MKNSRLFVIMFLLFQSCVISESFLKETEVYTKPNDQIIKKRNLITVRKRDSIGSYVSDYYGLHKSEYKYVKTMKGFKIKMISFYDIENKPIDLNEASYVKYYRAVYKHNLKGEIKEVTFYNHKNEFGHSLLNCSRLTMKHLKDGSLITRYFDSLNKPRCGDLGYEVKSIADTVYYIENDLTVPYLEDSTVYILDCKGNNIPIDIRYPEQ